MPRVLFAVSATVGAQRGPRKDYAALGSALSADVIDYTSISQSPLARLVARFANRAIAQAVLAFQRRADYDVILTDGEHIGIPLALMLKAVRARTAHVTIGHRITASKKRPFFRWLRVHSHISRIALHSRRQYELAIDELGLPAHRLALLPYQADVDFWQPLPEVAEERLICSVGLEFRDYPTLVTAVDGLDVKVVIAAASHWSKRRNTASDTPQPSNVEVDVFDYFALRTVYSRAAIVVVPLDDVDFQAGITTILEAMSMGKPVIVTHTVGQTDMVEDRRQITRGVQPRGRPESLLRQAAAEAGVAIEPNGFYVPPSDPGALRRAIEYLMERPDERARLGAAGRRAIEQLAGLDQYVVRLSALVNDAAVGTEQPVPAAVASAV
jgi:glycosyltransferase involved in cell wall biosynthesis